MATPLRRYTTEIGNLARDNAGLLWLIHQHIDLTGRGSDWALELLTRSLFSAGGVVEAGAVSLNGSEVEVIGPHLGITHDGATPVMLDAQGLGEYLDLSIFNAYGNGTHLVVVSAVPVIEEVVFNSQARQIRDESGRVISTIPGESITHEMTRTLGMLNLLEGTTPEDEDVPVATVDKSGSSWSNLVPVTTPPTFRWDT